MPYAEFITISISIFTIIISVGISYGIMKTKIGIIEQKVDRFDKDHDLLVELNTKIDMLLKKNKK